MAGGKKGSREEDKITPEASSVCVCGGGSHLMRPCSATSGTASLWVPTRNTGAAELSVSPAALTDSARVLSTMEHSQ
eukprot:3834602-Rhodomonas_salina.2